MTNFFDTRLILSAASISLCPGLAFADVTADQVWEKWQSYSEAYGQEITVGSRERVGNTLTLRDLKMAYDFPEGDASGSLEWLKLEERDDGTVVISMAPDYPVAVSAKPEEGDEIDLALIARQTDLKLIASGDDQAMKIDYEASIFSIDFERFFVGGEDVAPDMSVILNDVKGASFIQEGDLRKFDSDFHAASVLFEASFTDPDNGGTFEMDGELSDIRTVSSSLLPEGMDTNDPVALFSSGFATTAEFNAGPSTFNMDVKDGETSFSMVGGSKSSSAFVEVVEGDFAYGGNSAGTNYIVSSNEMPFPQLSFGIDQSEFQFRMPLLKTEEPHDVRLTTKLIGFSIDETLWNMFDPAATLPRDPITFVLDIAGALNWLVNISDPEELAALEEAGTPPAELHELRLQELKLSVAGAELTGDGAFTFDNTDLETFDGMPAPTGAVNLKIVGANGLLDNLTAMGILPQEQAMGARMMLGLFARPGSGPDTLVSTIEVNRDGSVFANGQQIQ